LEITQPDLIFGWTAILSAAATLGTAITGILFFAVNDAFGNVNDTFSVFQVVLMLPVAVALYLLAGPEPGWSALVALAVGCAGMVFVAVLQALLVAGKVRFEQTIAQVLAGGAVIGLWLILANALALAAGAFSWGLAAFGFVAGAGYVLTAVGFHRGQQEHPLFYAGSLLMVVGYSVWAIWLGLLLLNGTLVTGA
jgi:MFS family permease